MLLCSYHLGSCQDFRGSALGMSGRLNVRTRDAPSALVT